jgi:hypothetical protein
VPLTLAPIRPNRILSAISLPSGEIQKSSRYLAPARQFPEHFSGFGAAAAGRDLKRGSDARGTAGVFVGIGTDGHSHKVAIRPD